MDISIVLATYKRSSVLQRTLESFSRLKGSSLQWELWIVDNASDSATESVINFWREKLPINYLVEPKAGKNNALNRAIPDLRGKLIVLTDDDIIADPYWLIQLWYGVQRWPDHMVFGGRVLPQWPEGFEPHDLRNPYLVGAYAIADWKLPEGEYSPEKVFGPNMAVRREIFDSGWLFNSSIGPSQNANYSMGSETEFLLRLAAAGYKPVYLPESLVYHQIQPVQMSFSWLKGRAFRSGKGAAFRDGVDRQAKSIFGVPRYLIRQLVTTWAQYAYLFLTKSETLIEAGMRFYICKGMFAAVREINKGAKSGT